MGIDFDGFDETIDDLEQLQQRAEELDGTHSVSLVELFNPAFMQRYTEFEPIESFFDASPYTVNSREDLGRIPDGALNDFIDEHTVFESDEEMMDRAGAEYMKREFSF